MSQTLVFSNKKIDMVFKTIYAIVISFLLGFGFFSYWDTGEFMPLAIMLGISLFMLFLLLSSFYQLKIIIDGNFLRVLFLIEVYKTDIRNITKVRKGETMWSGIYKYGTGTKGLIVFSKFKNDLYITPDDEELFYRKIQEINPQVIIEIIGAKSNVTSAQ